MGAKAHLYAFEILAKLWFCYRPIEGIITLISNDTAKGSFNVNTTTSNNPIKIDYQYSPVDSTLIHTSRTSNSPALVSLHSAYEGLFSVETSLVEPSMQYDSQAKDPSGRHRKRWMELTNYDKRNVAGGLYWDSKNPGVQYGSVSITTSNAPADLLFP